ncbi:MAG: histidinol dehydrogenase [Leptospirales bacterium]
MKETSERLFEAKSLEEARSILKPLLSRGRDPEGRAVRDRVFEILENVQREGDSAVLRYARELDGYSGTESDWKVEPLKLQEAYESLSPPERDALTAARDRIREFHERILASTVRSLDATPGRAGVRALPLSRVGVYVPGGTAAYPSTVLMTAVVARVAGVADIIGTSPAGKTGIPAAILAAFFVAGVTDVYQVGGVQAIGAMAFGTQTIPPVDKIVGPGNRYVAEAKRQVFGTVDIDMVAGPSEVLVLADRSANPGIVAADLLAQAEHDSQAAAILITTERDFARKVASELDRQLEDLPRRKIARESLARFGFLLVVPNADLAIGLSDIIAPEHLEIHVENPDDWFARVRNAGAVFIGSDTAEAFGDYCYGPSHVLPTNGSARFSSPVSVETFLKRTSILKGFSSEDEKQAMIRTTTLLARLEGLEGHARAALIRSLGKDEVET